MDENLTYVGQEDSIPEVENLETKDEQVIEGEKVEEAKKAIDENESDSKENEDDQEEESETEDKENKPRKNGFQKRIQKLKQRETRALEEAEYWKRQATQDREENRTSQENQETKNDRPDPDDYESSTDYIDALTDWKLEKKLESHAKQQTKKNETEQVLNSFMTQEEALRKEVPNYDERLDNLSDLHFSDQFKMEVFGSEHGPKLALAIADDYELAEKMSKMSPTKAIKELGKLEAQIDREISSRKSPKVKKTSTAPAPISVTKGRGASATKDPASMSLKEYENWFEKTYN